MPIGLGTAVLGGAAIAGVGTIAAGAMSSHAQEKAANKAADTSLQTAQMNNDLFREIYGKNEGHLDPFSNNGLEASNALTDLLLGTHSYNPTTAPPPQSPAGGGTASFHHIVAGSGTQSAPVVSQTPIGQGPQMFPGVASAAPTAGALSPIQMGHEPPRIPTSGPGSLGNRPHMGNGGATAALGGFGNQPTTAPTPTPTPAPTGTGGSALDAWDQFRQGTNYQWRLNQGANVLNSKYAANGAFDSGAADKAAIEYGQNFASNELSNYMNLLAGQQAMGLSAAGALAGVGTTYAGNVAAQNTNAGNAAANAQLVAGQGQANMWGSIGQGIGQVGGALFQYGMGQQAPAATYAPAGINVNPAPMTNYFPGNF